jgi:hypothetical protein
MAQAVSRRPVFDTRSVLVLFVVDIGQRDRLQSTLYCTDSIIVLRLMTRSSSECRTAMQRQQTVSEPVVSTLSVSACISLLPQCHSTNARCSFTHHRRHRITANHSAVKWRTKNLPGAESSVNRPTAQRVVRCPCDWTAPTRPRRRRWYPPSASGNTFWAERGKALDWTVRNVQLAHS